MEVHDFALEEFLSAGVEQFVGDLLGAHSQSSIPGPLVLGRLDEPGPIATSLITLVGQLSRLSLLLHCLARTTDDGLAATLYHELTKVRSPAQAARPVNLQDHHSARYPSSLGQIEQHLALSKRLFDDLTSPKSTPTLSHVTWTRPRPR
ncbi:hypothetical protein [Lentzea flava]|uniref:Uncharacterized protein n=1 Tax=Lentzea flava TaxID=103732 RepID=A0ABQ2VHY0_9PSEU|nr:hypothetical protein [Lentzea flava]GGU87999.1 hypothetical protein GCM10010178_92070 [Lentzea flava]